MHSKKILIIEGCNFIDYPIGGQLSFSKRLIESFKNDIAIAGITTNRDEKIGAWTKKKLNGFEYPFFCFGYRNFETTRPLIPERIKNLIGLLLYKKKILKIGIKNIFIIAPEIMIGVYKFPKVKICYRFSGIENPLSMPRYRWGIFFAPFFDKLLFSALKNVNLIIAAADSKAIKSLVDRSNKTLDIKKVHSFPTRFDSNVFFPVQIESARSILKIPNDRIIITCVGRLNHVKGWDFLVDSFKLFNDRIPNSSLIFVGDGEDFLFLKNKIQMLSLEDNVLITGYKTQKEVAQYINSSNFFVLGSHREGWPTAVIEAFACGKFVVSTQVSGINDLIINDKNGLIVVDRNPESFSDAMYKASQIDLYEVSKYCIEIAKKYDQKNLKKDLLKLWKN